MLGTLLSSVSSLASSDGKVAVQKAEATIRMKEFGEIDWDLVL